MTVRRSLMVAPFLAASLFAAGATGAAAQQVRPISVDEAQRRCSARPGSRPEVCARIAQQARSRYGSMITPMQWQSASGVVGHKMRQGK